MKRQSSAMDLSSVITDAMFDKKASKIIVMDMRSVGGASFDVFVVCEAVSAIQVKSIADGIEEQVFKQLHEHPLHSEGFTNAEWILLDYGNVVVHVFQERIRKHINLEELWSDAKTTEPKEKNSVTSKTATKTSISKTATKTSISKTATKTSTPKTATKTSTPKTATKTSTSKTATKTSTLKTKKSQKIINGTTGKSTSATARTKRR